MEEVIRTLSKEMELQQAFLSEPLNTIYFGGGTPSLLTAGQLHSLLQTATEFFPVSAEPEITLEANPDDLSLMKLEQLKESGINRLSIGVQSFRDDTLHYLHRAHNAQAARQCLRDARSAGFQNISLDLIYAIPGLDLAAWEDTLNEALSFQPEHLSAYALTIEERTVFGNWKVKGKLVPVSDEQSAQQFERMQDVLEKEGYEHYEISNFALPGFHSRHNSSYWTQESYLGIGPSAHSFDGTRRLINVSNNAAYTRSILSGQLPSESEQLTPENKINEYILTRLRTIWGCNLETLREKYHDDLIKRCGPVIERHQGEGRWTLSGNTLKLTRAGMLLADQLIEELMIG